MEQGTVAIALPARQAAAEAALLRGRRVARELGHAWIALFVECRGGQSKETLSSLAALVRANGGDLRHTWDDDVASGLVHLSRDADVRWLVIGPSRRPRFLRRLIRGTTERILESSRSFSVIVARQEQRIG